jgi:hypothetical protein
MGNKTKALFNTELKGEIVMCLVKGIGMIIGKPSVITTEGVVPSIKSPRLVQILQDPNNEANAQVKMHQIIGSPEEIFLVEDVSFAFVVKDKRVKEHYVKTVSGIVLASTLPSTNKQ